MTNLKAAHLGIGTKLRALKEHALRLWRFGRCAKILLLSVLLISTAGLAAGGVYSAREIATPDQPRPNYLQESKDPVFGTVIIRVTDPGKFLGAGVRCEAAYCRHRYSSTQAWNADQSLLLIANGCNGMCFLDGRTYKPLFHRSNSDDCKWHPANPILMICVRQNGVYSWEPITNQINFIYSPENYSKIEFGPYKGNLSQDGTHLVLRAKNASGELVAFAYDLSKKQKYPDIPLNSLPGKNGYCGISPTSRYVACFQTTSDGTDTAHIFTIEGTPIQHWTEHHRPGHGDMTVEADGDDVYVGISKSDPDKWHIIKRRLRDGLVTDLGPAGYATHASARNINRPGWVFLTYEGTEAKVAENPTWAQFYREVVALRVDGSGEIRRIAHTHNSKSDYYSESHVSPSPDGSQVVWSSNWDESDGPVSDYVARIEWPASR